MYTYVCSAPALLIPTLTIRLVTFALPGISAEYCASYALLQMFKGKVTIVPTFTMKAAVIASKLAPRELAAAITAKQQMKKRKDNKH